MMVGLVGMPGPGQCTGSQEVVPPRRPANMMVGAVGEPGLGQCVDGQEGATPRGPANMMVGAVGEPGWDSVLVVRSVLHSGDQLI